MPRALKNQPGGWLNIPWEEYVGADASHGTSFATGWDGGSQITFQILVNWDDAVDAETELLGSAIFQAFTTPPTLQRTMPKRHPYKPSYFCERVLSATSMRWNDKLRQFQAVGFQGTSTGAPISEYAYFLLTLGFAVPKYRVLSDSDLLTKYGAMNEWKRFCETTEKSSVQIISRDASLWQWDDASLSINGNPLVAPVGVPINSSDLQVKWRRVPRAGLFGQAGESDFLNQNIRNNYNVVHNGVTNLWDMEGNANTGTLRFIGAEPEPIASPFDPTIQGLSTKDINVYYDVNMHFGVWRPPAGNATNQGWNLAPSPNNLWYLIKTATGGNRIFTMGDLSNVFQLTLQPNP